MSDQPAKPSREEGVKAFAEIFSWLVRLIIVGLVAYFGWYEPMMLSLLTGVFAPPYLLATWVGPKAFAVTVALLYAVFVASGAFRRHRARGLHILTGPFAPRPLNGAISAIAGLRRPVRRALFWLALPLGLAVQFAISLLAFSLLVLSLIIVPFGIAFAIDFLLSPWVSELFPLWILAIAAYAVVIPRRHRRLLLDYPWLSGRMVLRRIRRTLDRLLAALAGP